MAVRERRYNPGVLTGVGLMGVHAAASARALRRSGRLGRREALARLRHRPANRRRPADDDEAPHAPRGPLSAERVRSRG
jgi:hypothetical protein